MPAGGARLASAQRGCGARRLRECLGFVSTRVIPCVGAIIKDHAGRLLLIKRGHDPGKGLWSIPGGRIEDGESDADALVREVREETGLIVTAGPLIGAVRRPVRPGGASPDGADGAGITTELLIRDYAATVTGGDLRAGDDADDAAWAGPGELAALPLAEGLLEALREWGVA
jgi:8-oxo-dGTP diphosphatase